MNIFRDVILLLKPRGIKNVFWLDRVALVGFAWAINSYFLERGFLLIDLPTYIISDLALKDNGYIYSFQTLIAAMLAFIATRFIYQYSMFDKKQRSYMTAYHARAVFSSSSGRLKHLKDYFLESHSNLLTQHYEGLRAQLDSDLKYLKNIDPYILSPDISWHIIACIDALNKVTDALQNLTKLIDIDLERETFDLYASGIIRNCDSFEEAYEEINDYLSTYVYYYPPHSSKKK